MSAAERLASVREEMAKACRDAGREEASVKLIAVSKTKPFSMVRELADLGQLDFGENYAQEGADKVVQGPELHWHFIGNLQSNKAKLVAGKFSLFHALDSFSLAEKLAKVARQDCLVQVNVSAEDTKSGVAPGDLLPLLDRLRGIVPVRGLMCIPRPGLGRKPFADLRNLLEAANREGHELTELSMGMSADFADAILEGATYVRVGTALFGARG
jgi:pyridoxal phosphate enzyme (YggS family)